MGEDHLPYSPGKEEDLPYDIQYLAQQGQSALYPNDQHVQHAPSNAITAHDQQNIYGAIASQWQANLPMNGQQPVGPYHEEMDSKYPGFTPADSQYQYQDSVGLGIQYNGQSHSNGYHPDDQPEIKPNELSLQSTPNPGGLQSPPTPAPSDHSLNTRRTRSGRVIGPRASPQQTATTPSQSGNGRVTKSPSTKKGRASKREKPKAPRITAPLSELTKDYTHVPVRNMEAWVNRPPEVRWQEVEKRKGYVTRPMNSFMLYRSAYAERTKIWCLQNNHQVVSSVSGESWPLESAEIRERYNEYARIERENHQAAHPGYKFSPSKPNSAKKRKNANSEVDDASDLEDLDEDDEAGSSPTKGSKRSMRDANASANDPFQMGSARNHRLVHSGGVGPHQSSYQATNPGKPLPTAMEPHDLYSFYYQTMVQPSRMAPYIEDVRMQKTEMHDSSGQAYHGLVGLPGAAHQELYPTDPHGEGSFVMNHHNNLHLVDPILLASSNQLPHEIQGGELGHGNAGSYEGLPPNYASRHDGEDVYPEMQAPYQHGNGLDHYHHVQGVGISAGPEVADQGHDGVGQYENWAGGIDASSEFEKWYGEEK
ncbi:MAG: hypothetical protein M1823_000767 [Watsoniomyces obsoletus]|nr:MAG: hypothetical protein M1823_000767 [Watsoniomyces obsoletus]